MAQIAGKLKQLPEVRSCQANITNPAALQRLMHSFEHALQLLVAQASEMISPHTAVMLTSHCQYGFHMCTVHTTQFIHISHFYLEFPLLLTPCCELLQDELGGQTQSPARQLCQLSCDFDLAPLQHPTTNSSFDLTETV